MTKSKFLTISMLSELPKKPVLMYCTAICPYCVAAERFLAAKGVREIEKLRVDLQPELRQEMIEKTQRRTVPQIYIGDTHVGGYQDLLLLEREGKLDALLSAAGCLEPKA